MIPRFNYSYSLREAWADCKVLMNSHYAGSEAVRTLFPGAAFQYVSQARVGIYYALRSFDLEPGARVGVQPYTCSSVLSAIVAADCRPVFIDITSQLSIDPADLERKLPQLEALIVTHTLGLPAPIRQIREIMGTIPVLEDCAHAFLSRYEGQPVGRFFDAAVFSFGDGKFPSFGAGGLLVINKPAFAERVAALPGNLPKASLLRELTLIGKRLAKDVLHSRMGTRLQHRLFSEAAIDKRNKTISDFPVGDQQPYRSIDHGLQQRFTDIVERASTQHANARYLTEQHGATYPMLYDPEAGNAFAVVVVSDDRNNLYRFLRQHGIGAAKHFQHAKIWARQFGYQPGECPAFEHLTDRVLTIPCHYGLTQQDLKTIDECLHQYARQTIPTHEESIG